MTEIVYTVSGQVAYVTLNRPEALNAIAPPQRDRLITLLGETSADPSVRAVVLTGTGRGFCAGADLRGGGSSGERVAGDVARVIRLGAQRLIAAVLDCEKPVIAAVNGTAKPASAPTWPWPATSYWPRNRPGSSRSSYAAAWSRTAAARICSRA